MAGIDIGSILRSRFYRAAREQAERVLRDPEQARALTQELATRLQDLVAPGGPLEALKDDALALFRMVSAYTQKRYVEIPWQTMMAAIAGLVYLVMPLDALPDFIPLAGFIDDAAILAFLVKSIRDDLQRFRWWEDAHRLYRPGS